jgi:phosphatidylglycerol:prolipoprotein diacylglycerol transferase
VQPQSVGISYWFDTRPDGPAYDVPVRLVGTLVQRADLDDAKGAPAFDLVHTIRDVPAGVGRLCATIRITDTAPGLWDVIAYPPDDEPVRVEATAGFGPVIGEIAPGTSLGAWAALVGAGAVAGLGLFAGLAALAQLAVLPLVAIALVACIVGLVGAKVYFLVQSPGSPSWASPGGMCIQGFVIGALATLAAGAWLADVPLLVMLDIAAPAILLGMAIGRLGCWKGGCCAGRLTAGRFAVWCSDRRIGGRRIPTQLMESALALLLSVVTTVLVIGSQAPNGVAAVLGLSAYILVRQFLLRLRSVPRSSALRPMMTTALSGIAVLVSVALVIASMS